MSILSDESTYKRISKDPASSLERKRNEKLLSLKKTGALPGNWHYKIRSSGGKNPQFYGLPKVHKQGLPMRPIISFIQSPIYQLSKYLVTILSPLVRNSSSNVANSFEFSTFIQFLKE